MALKSIMIIDDSEADQFLAKMVVEEVCPDTEIHQAYDSEEALGILENLAQRPDIIFLDINMPRMNGLEFLDAYKKENAKESMIVMLSSSDYDEDIKNSMAHTHVKKYIMKPLDKTDLEGLIKLSSEAVLTG